MIFVTVGTHEQQFNRLIEYVDKLKKNGVIQEEVIIQTGFSSYKPEYCTWSKLFSYDEMIKNVAEARIVITHGGPASFIMPLQVGKIPVVVPRKKQFEEHVNDHQLEFSKAVQERQKNIIVVENIEEIEKIITEYNNIIECMSKEVESNNILFNDKFRKIVDNLFGKENY